MPIVLTHINVMDMAEQAVQAYKLLSLVQIPIMVAGVVAVVRAQLHKPPVVLVAVDKVVVVVLVYRLEAELPIQEAGAVDMAVLEVRMELLDPVDPEVLV